MRKRTFGIALVALLFSGAAEPPPRRIALVIGNGNYAYADPLPNALTDARTLSERLMKLGFEVEEKTVNLDRTNLEKSVATFGAKIKSLAPNVVSFFYYAGHAAQDQFGVNYLLAIDLKPENADVIRENGVPIAALLEDMEEANNDVNIVVLDACRDWFKGDRSAKDPRGLHDMGLHGSIFIAYATRPGDTAEEAPGLSSSPYSHRLIEALGTEVTEPISLLFDDVQTKVYADTDSFQLPIYVNGLIRAGRWAVSSGSLNDVADVPRPSIVDVTVSPFLQNLDRAKLLNFAKGNVSFVDVLLKRRDLLERSEINTPNRLAFFIAAIAFETAGFKQQVERFGYSAAALRRIFASRVTSDDIAGQLAGKPEAIANFVYANRFGNGPPESGDGWRYRGRSLFFITGRNNYKRYGDEVGVDLVNSPDLANDLETGFAIATSIWRNQGVNASADDNDLAGAARRFRGASAASDLEDRQIWLAQAKRALGIDSAPPSPR